jgi:LmbE family N-acetylglucosaminyl deacetylase
MTLEAFPEDWQRALAVVAHPDDLEYGAAAAIAKWTAAGKWVGYVLATSGEAGIDGMAPDEAGPAREAEEIASAAVVGVTDVEFLGLPDGTLTYGLELRRAIAAAVRRHRPDIVLSVSFRLTWGPSRLNMADHRVLGEALLDGARDAGNRWVFPELVDDGLEPWGGVRLAAFSGSPTSGHAVDITGWLDKGIESLAQHDAYLRGLGDGTTTPDDVLRPAAVAAGAELGVEHAVTFEVFEL